MSLALTARVVRLEQAMEARGDLNKERGRAMQLGRIEKRQSELVQRLNTLEPLLEQVRLDLDKVTARLMDEVV